MSELAEFNINNAEELETHYADYISVLNKAQFDKLPSYLCDKIIHTERELTKQQYRELVPEGCQFIIVDVLSSFDKREISARLAIRIGPRRLREIIFYHFDEDWRIFRAWSMVEEFIGGKWRAYDP